MDKVEGTITAMCAKVKMAGMVVVTGMVVMLLLMMLLLLMVVSSERSFEYAATLVTGAAFSDGHSARVPA